PLWLGAMPKKSTSQASRTTSRIFGGSSKTLKTSVLISKTPRHLRTHHRRMLLPRKKTSRMSKNKKWIRRKIPLQRNRPQNRQGNQPWPKPKLNHRLPKSPQAQVRRAHLLSSAEQRT